jgi:hypothetical protein
MGGAFTPSGSSAINVHDTAGRHKTTKDHLLHTIQKPSPPSCRISLGRLESNRIDLERCLLLTYQ